MFDIGLRLVIGVAQYKQETFMETTNTRPRTKIVIVGGVAGGASCAARLRRLDENAEIIMVEKGPYVSYANCGLPYHVGGVIEKESSLLVATANTFRVQFNVDVRTNFEATRIVPETKTIELRNVETGEVTSETYDKLVLSPGAPSVRPPLPGIDLPGIFQVRTVPDARAIREWIERGTTFLSGMDKYSGFQTIRPKTRAVVIGGGFIGLETAENLVHRGFDVTLVEMLDQILAPLDVDMARIVEDYVERHGIRLALNDGVAGFQQTADGALEVLTKAGKSHPADIVILALGVRPDTALAKTAGLEIGQRGGIRVDEQMRTSNPDIFAVGDAVEVKDFVTGEWSLIALAGPANRQGRIAADVDRRAPVALPRHPGHLDHRPLRRRRRLGRRQREDAQAAGRQRLREGLPLPELARRLLPRRPADRHEGAVPEIRRALPRRPGGWRGWGGQADQRAGHGAADGRDDLRSRGG
jgi:NADPH-dependent 2,4-dienoyl-CoA reductase/sulfur reductase-like enzyme